MLVRQLEDEVVKAKTHASQTNPEVKAHLEALQVENDHLSREIAILRETVKVKKFTQIQNVFNSKEQSLLGLNNWAGGKNKQLDKNTLVVYGT